VQIANGINDSSINLESINLTEDDDDVNMDEPATNQPIVEEE